MFTLKLKNIYLRFNSLDAKLVLNLSIMKKTLLISTLLMVFAIVSTAQNQELIPPSEKGVLTKGLYFGGVASTNGWGAELRYLFNDKFTVKASYETLYLSSGFDFDENDISYDASVNYKTGGIFLLADYNFIRHLHISGGIVFNSFNPEIKGHSVNDLQYGDIIIPASEVGDFIFTASPELKVSPYVGLGWRSFIGKNERLVFNLGTGIYYMGPPQIEIEATGLLAPTADPSHGQKELLEKQFEQYKFYPVLKLNLAVKLF